MFSFATLSLNIYTSYLILTSELPVNSFNKNLYVRGSRKTFPTGHNHAWAGKIKDKRRSHSLINQFFVTSQIWAWPSWHRRTLYSIWWICISGNLCRPFLLLARRIPVTDITAETIARTFLSHWIAKLDVPSWCGPILTTDQGRQFESHLVSSLNKDSRHLLC